VTISGPDLEFEFTFPFSALVASGEGNVSAGGTTIEGGFTNDCSSMSFQFVHP
jgi:hypothetical protein